MRSVLEWANRDFGASFDVERSSRDTLLYPYEVVRAALANVLIKKKKGYPFENPGAVLWEGISLEDYRKEEFSVASLDEVLRLTEEQDPEPVPKNEELPRREARPPASEGERRRAEASLEVFESLPKDVREDIERRAEALAREGLVSRGLPFEQAILSLRKLSCQKEILEREHASELAARLSSHDSHFWKIEPECLQSPEARDAPIKA